MGSKVDKTKRALIGAGGRILFYPTLFYNLVRFKLQSQFRWWDQIDEYLLMGAVPFRKDVSRLKHLGVGGVITLNEPFETLVPSSLYNVGSSIPPPKSCVFKIRLWSILMISKLFLKAYEMEHLVIPTCDYLFAPLIADITRAVNFIHSECYVMLCFSFTLICIWSGCLLCAFPFYVTSY
ncbi:PREDICTED: putative dual specificity protein phosphatase DSP8 isoform X2 [Camelina sativa]|uniref:Dual specificity protein phosphatase DSP8 isoform X2 n=1 Tax=Camelina sativa TaxID=90675 RepID=A0ABM0UYW8_CAMSA|nr:PREDICTED: putative dual specificity protein phosphatase DSP8 isoform X2 [Camelina sativa]